MGAQIPEFSSTVTENIPLVLSYDKLAPTEGDFRHDLVEFLIKNGALNLKCFVATTIYFEISEEEKPLAHWAKLLFEKFGETFHFFLNRVDLNENKFPQYIEYKRSKLATDFSEVVGNINKTDS